MEVKEFNLFYRLTVQKQKSLFPTGERDRQREREREREKERERERER